MESLIASTVNLLILLGFLGYKLRGPLKEFVSQRHTLLKTEIQTVSNQLKEAQEKFNEFSSRLKSVQSEVSAIREQNKQDALQMKQRILNEAQRTATTIVSDSKTVAQGLYSQLAGQLYTELSFRVLDRSEKLLRERLTGDDRARIRQEFSRQVESIQ